MNTARNGKSKAIDDSREDLPLAESGSGRMWPQVRPGAGGQEMARRLAALRLKSGVCRMRKK